MSYGEPSKYMLATNLQLKKGELFTEQGSSVLHTEDVVLMPEDHYAEGL